MDKQHTPGPWRLEEVADDSGRIVHLCPCDTQDQSILTVVKYGGVKFAAVFLEADARLIAAAPDMLAELKKLEKLLQAISLGDYPVSDELESLQNVIAKATQPAASSRGDGGSSHG